MSNIPEFKYFTLLCQDQGKQLFGCYSILLWPLCDSPNLKNIENFVEKTKQSLFFVTSFKTVLFNVNTINYISSKKVTATENRESEQDA